MFEMSNVLCNYTKTRICFITFYRQQLSDGVFDFFVIRRCWAVFTFFPKHVDKSTDFAPDVELYALEYMRIRTFCRRTVKPHISRRRASYTLRRYLTAGTSSLCFAGVKTRFDSRGFTVPVTWHRATTSRTAIATIQQLYTQKRER